MQTSPTGTSSSKSKAAFTLIELLVVLVALVVLASAVVPALRNAGHQQDLAEVADRVAASARFARDEAVARQASIVLTVAPAPAAVQLAVDASGMMGAPGSMAMGAPGGAPLRPLSSAFAHVPLPLRFQARLEALPETFNGSVTATPASGGALDTLRFPPDGRTLGGMILLTDDRGHTLRVVVTPDTGVVRVEAQNG